MAGLSKAKLRNQMEQRMLNNMSKRIQLTGIAPEDILVDIYENPKSADELKYKAASKVTELLYPRASTLSVDMKEDPISKEEIDNQLSRLLSLGLIE